MLSSKSSCRNRSCCKFFDLKSVHFPGETPTIPESGLESKRLDDFEELKTLWQLLQQLQQKCQQESPFSGVSEAFQ